MKYSIFYLALLLLVSSVALADPAMRSKTTKAQHEALISDIELLTLSEKDLLRIIGDRLIDGEAITPEMEQVTHASSSCNGGIGQCSGSCSSTFRSLFEFWPWGEDCVRQTGTCRRSYNPFYEFMSCLCNVTSTQMVPCPEGV